jgi:hypothetical protein
MPVTLPAEILYTTQQLLADDENVILQRLYDRDAALLTGLNGLVAIREDLVAQFERLPDLEARWQSLSQVIDTIIRSFYGDIDGNGNVTDNLAFFHQLITDLRENINSINSVTAGIVRYEDVQDAVIPVITKLDQIADVDILIQSKLDHIYGKWDIDPADDIFSA